jgi:hypothetical protein
LPRGKRPAALSSLLPWKAERVLLWLTLTAAALGFFFRRMLRARLMAALPDRTTRHGVLTAIIAAFVIVFAIRLAVRFWG